MSSQNNDTIKAESDHFQRTFRATNITQLLFLGEKSTKKSLCKPPILLNIQMKLILIKFSQPKLRGGKKFPEYLIKGVV